MSASSPGLWHIIALALLALAPVQLWLKRPVWSLETHQLPQLFALAIGYLAFVLVLHLATDRPRGIKLITALGWGIACFGAAALLVLVRSDLALSRGCTFCAPRWESRSRSCHTSWCDGAVP